LPARDHERLVCPTCGRESAADERLCPACGVPLAYPAALEGRTEEPASELRRDARRVKPAYTGGRLVRVAGVRNPAEGELVRGLLLDAGVPSMLQSSSGAGLPYMPGPCDVLVPEAGLQAAREALRVSERRGARQDENGRAG
jgi:hypothetical protein